MGLIKWTFNVITKSSMAILRNSILIIGIALILVGVVSAGAFFAANAAIGASTGTVAATLTQFASTTQTIMIWTLVCGGIATVIAIIWKSINFKHRVKRIVKEELNK